MMINIGYFFLGIVIFIIGVIVGGRLRHESILFKIREILKAHQHDQDFKAILDDIILMLIGERVE